MNYTGLALAAGLLVLVNGLALLAVDAVLKLLEKKPRPDNRKPPRIARRLQTWLLVAVAVSLLGSSLFTYTVQTRIAESEATTMLTQSLDDVSDELDLTVNTYMRDVAATLLFFSNEGYPPVQEMTVEQLSDVNDDGKLNEGDISALLSQILPAYQVSEVSLVDRQGIIRHSSNPNYIGFDMAADTPENRQAYSFYQAMQNREWYVQNLMPSSYDASAYLKYGAIAMEKDSWLCQKGGFLQIGFDSKRLQSQVDAQVQELVNCRHVGKDGVIAIFEKKRRCGCRFKPGKHERW